MSDEKCCTGCNIFYGGEIRHIKECFFYPESLTEIYDRKGKENAKLKEENARLREALESISKNACCESCQEAKKVAINALKENK